MGFFTFIAIGEYFDGASPAALLQVTHLHQDLINSLCVRAALHCSALWVCDGRSLTAPQQTFLMVASEG